jgi:hypothetical protein
LNPIYIILQLATKLQLNTLQADDRLVVLESGLGLEMRASLFDNNHLRLDLVLLKQVSSSRLVLWNILHLNQFCFPMGQLLVAATHELLLRLNLPAVFHQKDWLETVLVHALSTSDGWVELLRNDHQDLPLDGSPIETTRKSILTNSPPWFSALSVLDAETGLHMLEHLLSNAFGTTAVRRLGALELAISNEYVCHIHLIRPRRHVLPDPSVSWYVGLRTEVGCVPRLDAELVIRLNQFNATSSLLASTLVFHQRKHLVLLTSGLPLEVLQHPSMLVQVIEAHQLQAAALYDELHELFGLRSVAGYHLGF